MYKMPPQMLKWLIVLLIVSACKGKSVISLDNIYMKGVQAYTGERWTECIMQFEESLHLFKLYSSIFNNCGVKCKIQGSNSQIDPNFEELKVFETFLNERYCLIDCREKDFEAVQLNSVVKESVLKNIGARKPYAYLHLCYYQMNSLQKAASAAYTYLQAHPNDDVMKKNLKYYVELPEVNSNELVDLESEDFEVLHKVGLESYDQKKWGETIMAMEEVLIDYLAWEKGCRIACEHLPEQEWSSEFVVSVSNNMLSVLQCRQQCQNKLSTLGYKSGVEFLGDTLNYLQISYYHLERFDDAARTVASYLALYPTDEDMLHNKALYSSYIDEKAFIERSEIIYYLKNYLNEKEILSHFYQTNTYEIKSNSIEF